MRTLPRTPLVPPLVGTRLPSKIATPSGTFMFLHTQCNALRRRVNFYLNFHFTWLDRISTKFKIWLSFIKIAPLIRELSCSTWRCILKCWPIARLQMAWHVHVDSANVTRSIYRPEFIGIQSHWLIQFTSSIRSVINSRQNCCNTRLCPAWYRVH